MSLGCEGLSLVRAFARSLVAFPLVRSRITDPTAELWPTRRWMTSRRVARDACPSSPSRVRCVVLLPSRTLTYVSSRTDFTPSLPHSQPHRAPQDPCVPAAATTRSQRARGCENGLGAGEWSLRVASADQGPRRASGPRLSLPKRTKQLERVDEGNPVLSILCSRVSQDKTSGKYLLQLRENIVLKFPQGLLWFRRAGESSFE